MILKPLFALFTVLTLFPTLQQAHGSEALALDCDWEQVMDKDGIVAWRRPVPGTPIMEIRAAGIIQQPVEVLAEALRDVPAGPLWIPNCVEARVLSRRDKNNMTMHHVIKTPWPCDWRDVVLATNVTYRMEYGRGICDLTVEDAPSLSANPDRVRIRDFKARFVFEYLGPKATGFILTTRVDPGGYLPAFLVNFFSKHFAFRQIENLRELAKDPKYARQAQASEDQILIQSWLSDREKAREIFKNRLSEFILDPEFVDTLCHSPLFDRFHASRGEVGEMGAVLILGWGSRDSRFTAAKKLLLAYAETITRDRNAARNVAENESLGRRLVLGDREAFPGPVAQSMARLLGCPAEK
ncbi:MAG: hypothetical protein KKA60_05200 [Proteobacteria bacterium]|nr:hypothetical protein [Pseudomonadota bacterium]